MLIALWALAALVVFAFALIATFPYNASLSRLLAPYQLKLVYQAQHPRLPIGVELENVRLFSLTGPAAAPLLESPGLSLEPTLGSLLFGRAGVRLAAGIFGGTLRATLEQNAGAIAVTFDAQQLSLAQTRPLAYRGAEVGGVVSGRGTAQIQRTNFFDNSGEGIFTSTGVTLRISEGLPLIHLGDVTGRIIVKDGMVTLLGLESHGGDLDANADGVIHLAPALDMSTIQARVALTPTASGVDHFGFFIRLLPHPPADGPYYLRGPLRAPSIN
jgi:type II secretion system protein N